jgi:predicted RNase H-like HicB family nuclease
MLHIPYTSQLFEEDEQFVALCPELNLSSFGDTPDKALVSLQEVVTLFLEECQHMGTLEVVLEEAGYRYDPLTKKWTPRQPIQINRLEAAFA